MPKTNSKIILIIVSVVFVILLAFNIFWFNFIKNQSDKVLELKKDVESEITNNHTVVSIQRNTQELEKKEEDLDKIFIDQENVVVFIEKIERMANQSNVGLQIQNVEVEDIKNSRGDRTYGLIKMTLSSSGDWSSVTTFLKMIETMPNNVSIDSLTMVTVSSQGSPFWSANFSLTGITN
jgi:Tfp pilus assembly protein PilO